MNNQSNNPNLTVIVVTAIITTAIAIPGDIITSFANEVIKKNWLEAPEMKVNKIKSSTTKNSIDRIVKLKIASEEKKELQKQKEDYELIIENIQKISRENDCVTKWNQKEKCYLEGRLLTKEKFEREIAEMRFEVSKINESLRIYD